MADQTIRHFCIEKGKFSISGSLLRMGEDYLLSIQGGRAHIGAVAMAQPRPSLADEKRLSATASVFCYVGHKEDALVKRVSEKLAAALGTRVVVAAGLHWDDITPDEIEQVVRNVDALVELVLNETHSAGATNTAPPEKGKNEPSCQNE